jgi:OFA family oxalate/formate antiporter-like MFS transporter
MLLVNGVIYAWSIYSGPFSEQFDWTSKALGMCFTVILGSFCIGGVIGGIITAKKGIGISIPAGGTISCLGFCLCVFLNAGSLWLLYICFCLSGLGVGIVYNAILGSVVSRFPDKKGTASGVLLIGFGASSLVIGSTASVLMNSPLGWRTTYIITGALLFAAALIGRIFIQVPKSHDIKTDSAPLEGMMTSEMIRSSSFWIFFVVGMIGSAFGSGIIGHARYIALEAGAAASLATVSVGLISVMNGLGRIFFGIFYDKAGFRAALFCDAGIFIIAGVIAMLSLKAGLVWLTLIAMMLCGLAYGGIPTSTSAVVGEFFGHAWYGKNFSVMNLNILPASFSATFAGAIQTLAGTYVGAFKLFIGIEVIAVFLIAVLGKIRSKG